MCVFVESSGIFGVSVGWDVVWVKGNQLSLKDETELIFATGCA